MTDKALKLAQHIIAMADDSYLTGHPEWFHIVEDALAVIADANSMTRLVEDGRK